MLFCLLQMVDSQKFCLKWDGFQSSVTSVFDHLRRDGELVDITLCCEGQRVRAHRMMLSACSPYFRELLKVGYMFSHILIRVVTPKYIQDVFSLHKHWT